MWYWVDAGQAVGAELLLSRPSPTYTQPTTHLRSYGTHVLLECARLYGKVRRFINVSTDEVYGESSLGKTEGLKEHSPLEPTNPYSAAKAGAEMMARAYHTSYKCAPGLGGHGRCLCGGFWLAAGAVLLRLPQHSSRCAPLLSAPLQTASHRHPRQQRVRPPPVPREDDVCLLLLDGVGWSGWMGSVVEVAGSAPQRSLGLHSWAQYS